MRSLRKMRREYSRLIDRTFDEVIVRAEQEIAEAYHDAAEAWTHETVKAYQEAGKEIPWSRLPVADAEEPITTIDGHEVGRSFFRADPDKLEIIVRDVRWDMDKARYSAIERSGFQHTYILKKADVYLHSGTMTPHQAVEMASKEIADEGLNSVRYKDGTQVNVASYVSMALRTSGHRAVLAAEGAKRREWNLPLVISPVLHTTCDICLRWQGKILIDDVFAEVEVDPDDTRLRVSQSVEDGFLHPNCRHPLSTYIEGVTQIPTASDRDKTSRQYKAEQRQRAIERAIRRYKRREALAGSDEERLEANRKVKQWQARMRDHLGEHPYLRRDYQREKLMPDAELEQRLGRIKAS